MRQSVRPTTIQKVNNSSVEEKADLVVVEEPLEIRIGYGPTDDRQQTRLAVTMRTPGNDFELVLGFLFTEGILSSYEEVESIKYCLDGGKAEEKDNVVRVELKPKTEFDLSKLNRNFYVSSSCGVCGKSSIDAVFTECNLIDDDFVLTKDLLNSLPEKTRQAQLVFEYTGGIHASALFDVQGNLILLREDVGRHNALDKIVGASLLKGALPLSNTILLLSGRASFELLQKAAMSGIPFVMAVGSPSSLAVSLAQKTNISLLGFVRDQRFNIYSGSHRIDC
jgi:FdhD protein